MSSLLQQVADSTAIDTSATPTQADSSAFNQLSLDVGEVALDLASGRLDLVWNKLYEGMGSLVVTFIPRLFSALFVLVLFYSLYRILAKLLNKPLEHSQKIDVGLHALLMKTFRVLALVFISVMVLAQFGINVTALLAGLSIVGIAVGFAAKDTLENFISGITILVDKPFRVGDYIDIEDIYGCVEEITLRSTRLRTPNNEMMVMPNIHMINQKLINHTMLGILRIEIPFGIAYKEYPQHAREVVLKLGG